MRAARLSPFALVACIACGGAPGGERGHEPASMPSAVPVHAGRARRATLPVQIVATGQTVSIERQRVRAPFNALVVDLMVEDGDRVRGGQAVAKLVSQESRAAVIGAEKMLAAAHTPLARRDAERALRLARRGLVVTVLRAPEAGVVVSHSSDEGDLVAQGQELAVIAAADSIVFVADVLQSDLPRVVPGEAASIDLASRRAPLAAVVHAVLPAGSSRDLTVPVRLDFRPLQPAMPLGVFGIVHVTVGTERDALVVPAAAVLRDDITGVTRVAAVEDGRAHWLVVRTGLAENGVVEITAAPTALAPGVAVVTQGQVGLPDGARVRIEP